MRGLKPGFHPNAIGCVACVACVAFGWKPGLSYVASALYDVHVHQRQSIELHPRHERDRRSAVLYVEVIL